ncbi:MAG: FlxA-like family protein [Candidatus Bathyarchaeia archaeon]
MEKKLILALIIMLLGLVGGYGLNHIIYQSQMQHLQKQIQSLQEQLNDLTSKVNSMVPDFLAGNATFHEVTHVIWNKDENATSGNYVTDTFLLTGKLCRIRWWMTGATFDSTVIFWLYFENGKKFTHRCSSGFAGSFDSLIDLTLTGLKELNPTSRYYLNITIEYGIVVAYEVWIYDYY